MSEAVAASLASLWSAMAPRAPAPAILPPDVGAIAAAAEAQGYARGRAAAEAELLPARAALQAATTAFEAAAVIDDDALRPVFAELVGRVAAAVIDLELATSPAVIERLVAAALAAIELDGAPLVHLCPADAARLGAVADPALAPGEVRIETPRHVVAASLGARLAAIVAELA